MKLIDTHTHLYEPEFDADRDAVVARAVAEGVTRLLFPAIDSASHARMLDMCRRHPGLCIPMMGLHPTSVNDNPRWREELSEVSRYLDASTENPEKAPETAPEKFCAVGEIGLDFYWSDAFKSEQREAFVAQLRMAAAHDLPVVIHTRAAWEEMVGIVEAESARAAAAGQRLRGVFHAFTEGVEVWRQLSRFDDFMVGIGGVVTFRKSAVAEAVREIPLWRMVLETDSPYLTPVPHRGTRNESAYVVHICRKVAELKGLSEEEVAAATTRNAERLFGL